MCLHRLTEFECPNEGIGYKVMGNDSRESKLWRGPYKGNWIKEGKEAVIINKYDLCCENGHELYTTGFHVFLKIEDAITYKQLVSMYWASSYLPLDVVEVKYRNILAKGLHSSYDLYVNCIVVECMTVIGRVNLENPKCA
jgi:hypothetical protein